MSLTAENVTLIERRVLSYLDQCSDLGSAHRHTVVSALASPDSKIGRGFVNGSNAGVPLIMGTWCARLKKAGYVIAVTDDLGFYSHHAITPAGRAFMRSLG